MNFERRLNLNVDSRRHVARRSRLRLRFNRQSRRARGFTIIELLVVVALIILLLSILIVAVSAATRTSKNASTQALMDSMKKALIRFKGDIGYYPPVLGVSAPGGPTGIPELRRLYAGSVPNPDAPGNTYIDQMQQYYSTCTLADYLIGYGNHQQDGYGRVEGAATNFDWDKETPPLGIRHPGSDGVWGATLYGTADGGLASRMRAGVGSGAGYGSEVSPMKLDQGKVFGPYLEMKDERILAGVNYGTGGLETYFPGDALPGGLTWDTIPKAIVDYWGMPIRYYRRPYPQGAIGQSYRSVDRNADGIADRVPTLSDVYVLRPQTFKPGTEISNPYDDPNGSTSTTSELESAEFALLSSGGDRNLDDEATVDATDVDGDGRVEENKDNLVEVGP